MPNLFIVVLIIACSTPLVRFSHDIANIFHSSKVPYRKVVSLLLHTATTRTAAT